MKLHQGPWGVLAIQLPLYKTSIEEKYDQTQHQFRLRAVPQFQSLAWITCGPALGILALIVLGIAASIFQVSDYGMAVKASMGCALFIIPALGWGLGGWFINKLAEKNLEKQAQAQVKVIEFVIDKDKRYLQIGQQSPLAFDEISAVRLMSDDGLYYNPNAEITPLQNLVLETGRGPVKVLPKFIGNMQQKLQLQSQLETLLKP